MSLLAEIVSNVHYFVNSHFRGSLEISSTITSPLIRPATPADAAAIRRVLVAAFPTDAEARLVELLTARGKATISLVAEVEGTVIGHVLFSPATVGPAGSAGTWQAARERGREGEGENLAVGSSPTHPLSHSPSLETGLGLAPVAVHPDFQNRGIGSALVRAGLAECRGLVAVSEPEGERGRVGEGETSAFLPLAPSPPLPLECQPLKLAQPMVHWIVLLGHETYYPRFGFAPASRWNLTGDYGSHDAFQFLPLTAAANEIRGGHIRYAAEFGEIVG